MSIPKETYTQFQRYIAKRKEKERKKWWFFLCSTSFSKWTHHKQYITTHVVNGGTLAIIIYDMADIQIQTHPLLTKHHQSAWKSNESILSAPRPQHTHTHTIVQRQIHTYTHAHAHGHTHTHTHPTPPHPPTHPTHKHLDVTSTGERRKKGVETADAELL